MSEKDWKQEKLEEWAIWMAEQNISHEDMVRYNSKFHKAHLKLLNLAEEHFTKKLDRLESSHWLNQEEIARLETALATQAQENEKLNQSVGWHSEQKAELEGKLENATSQVLIESNKRQAMIEKIEIMVEKKVVPDRYPCSSIFWLRKEDFTKMIKELKKGGEQ